MKYIVINFEGKEMIFLFSADIDHDRMYEGIQAVRIGAINNWVRIWDADVVSAGFVNKQGVCFGESMTLDKKSRGEVDTKLLGIKP
jgi:hypothetical protein